MRNLLAFVDPDEDAQDIFFLIAAIIAVIAAVLHYPAQAWPSALLCLAVAAIAIGLLFLA